jgi:hypothetical protein
LKAKGNSKVLFSEQESTANSQRKRLSKKSQDAAAEFYAALVRDDTTEGVAAAHQSLRDLAKEAQSAAQEQASQRPVQTRGVQTAGGDKYRVTAIFFQSVEKWFDPDAVPQGQAQIRSQKMSLSSL